MIDAMNYLSPEDLKIATNEDRSEIAQRVFKNRERSIGATGFEPAT